MNVHRVFQFITMSSKQTFIIITTGNEPIQEIATQLKTKGFTIDSTLEAIGQIIAKGTDEMKKEAMQIKGVSDVLPSHDDINIGTPGDNMTW